MIRRISLLVVILILSLAMPALAAESGDGIIEGKVINGTKDGSSVADLEITLTTYINDAEADSATARTDAEGQFVFTDLVTEPGYSYQAKLYFQQVEYIGDWLSFDGDASIYTEVVVYETTTSNETLTVVNAHTIVYVQEGSLQVKEYALFANMSDRTYVGSQEINAGVNETLKFSLPEGATDFQIGSGLMECCIYSNEDGFVDSMPVLPGSKEVVYSYWLDYKAGKYAFSRSFNYPTRRYDFLVQGEGSAIDSEQLVPEEPLEIGGIRFNHGSAVGLAAGDILVTRISGLPQSGNQLTIIWVVVTLVVLAGGFSYFMRKRRFQPVKVKSGPDRQKLLAELAQLDDDFESGKIPEEVYRRLRAEKKSQLIELHQKKKSDGG